MSVALVQPSKAVGAFSRVVAYCTARRGEGGGREIKMPSLPPARNTVKSNESTEYG